MARIVVHPEQMRLAGQQWQRTTGELHSLAGRLSSAIGGIDWETRRRSGVDWEWDRCRSLAGTLAARAEDLSRQLRTKADSFQEADYAGARLVSEAVRPLALTMHALRLLERVRPVLAFPGDHIGRLLSLGLILGQAPAVLMTSLAGISSVLHLRASGTKALNPIRPGWQDRLSQAAAQSIATGSGSGAARLPPPLVDTKSASNPFLAEYHGQCTYWAWERYHQVTGREAPFRGNGGQWAEEAASHPGWKAGTQPRVGAFAVILPYVYQGGNAVGHVAYVESIEEDGTFTVSEMNRLGRGDGPHVTQGYPETYLFYAGTTEDDKKRALGSVKFVYRAE